MSSPSINRWGLNLFWYRFWYTDKNISFLVTQDDIFNKLLLIYIHYGVLYNKTPFMNKYWWSFLKNFIKNYNLNYNTKYFRTIEYKNKIINETRRYKLRNKLKNLYFSKIWILRYQNWLIINFYAYQPLTKKFYKKNKFSKESNFYLSKIKKDNLRLYYRIKLYLFFSIYQNLLKTPYYKF